MLILNEKYEEAFKTEYRLFFVSPFEHNTALLNILDSVKGSLEIISNDQEKFKSMNLFEKSIFFFYSNQTEASLSELDKHLEQNKDHQDLIY